MCYDDHKRGALESVIASYKCHDIRNRKHGKGALITEEEGKERDRD